MKIIREGDVLFRNGKIIEINNFEVETKRGGDDTLKDYVLANYMFKGVVT